MTIHYPKITIIASLFKYNVLLLSAVKYLLSLRLQSNLFDCGSNVKMKENEQNVKTERETIQLIS